MVVEGQWREEAKRKVKSGPRTEKGGFFPPHSSISLIILLFDANDCMLENHSLNIQNTLCHPVL